MCREVVQRPGTVAGSAPGALSIHPPEDDGGGEVGGGVGGLLGLPRTEGGGGEPHFEQT